MKNARIRALVVSGAAAVMFSTASATTVSSGPQSPCEERAYMGYAACLSTAQSYFSQQLCEMNFVASMMLCAQEDR